jgi:hypothetical protein
VIAVLEEHGTIRFVEFLDEWVERYRGQGRRGFRVHTRNEYRRLIRHTPILISRNA